MCLSVAQCVHILILSGHTVNLKATIRNSKAVLRRHEKLGDEPESKSQHILFWDTQGKEGQTVLCVLK